MLMRAFIVFGFLRNLDLGGGSIFKISIDILQLIRKLVSSANSALFRLQVQRDKV
jgi:hypothetical protein